MIQKFVGQSGERSDLKKVKRQKNEYTTNKRYQKKKKVRGQFDWQMTANTLMRRKDE